MEKKKTLLTLSAMAAMALFSCGGNSIAVSSSQEASSEVSSEDTTSETVSSESSIEESSIEEFSSEEELPTSFALSASNGAWKSPSYTGTWDDNHAGLVEAGSAYPMRGYYAMAKEGYYAQLKRDSGVIMSLCDIGMTSIKVAFESSSAATIRLYSTVGAEDYQEAELTSGETKSVEGVHAFSIHAGASALLIESIEIVYEGEYECTVHPVDPSDLPYEGGCYKTSDTYHELLNYKSMQNMSYCDAIDTRGSCEDFLVIPVELSDYPFTDETIADLDPLFNGEGKSDTGYWESLGSFYSKSSFGKFNPRFEIAPVLELGMTAAELAARPIGGTYTNQSQIALREGIKQYKADNGEESTQRFDGDGDGLIDGVILIYSCPDYSRSQAIAELSSDLYWAFCYWDYGVYDKADPDSPIANNYFWCSYDFSYEAVSSPKVDAHTLIHEFGHMCGLDDYYSYDYDSAPAGSCQMMDANILDHDPFSKFALGWIDPYVITDEATVTIKPGYSSGDAVIVAPTWNGTAFDEYLIMELFVPKGLNELDSRTAYPGRTKPFSKPGVRMYHVDSRASIVTNAYGRGEYVDDAENLELGRNEALRVDAANSKSRRMGEASDNGYNLIQLIEANGRNQLGNSYWATANDSDLFHEGDYFEFEEYASFFPRGDSFNGGEGFDYLITFDEVSAESATISFKII
ncbi:MAG: hypothetical protein K6F32_02125 [Bacilli bacterium]|nr:hypothetical protein [Bacilli bacterium]